MAKKGMCLILICVLFLVGCHGKSNQSAYEVFWRIQSKVEIPNCEVYQYAKDKLQDRVLSRLYSRDDDIIPPAVAFCDDYLICLYNGNDIWELHIFRTLSIYDNKRIYEMLVMRRDILQDSEAFSYYSEETQKRVLSAEIINFRNFVILAVTDHNAVIRNELAKIK